MRAADEEVWEGLGGADCDGVDVGSDIVPVLSCCPVCQVVAHLMHCPCEGVGCRAFCVGFLVCELKAREMRV